ncbi:hypothetical protein B0H13DRAFT_2401500 [Mycena leptocephala]|nr:hypothetical protein B0H13DRAFT_2401500 [Mycena leptocephala]
MRLRFVNRRPPVGTLLRLYNWGQHFNDWKQCDGVHNREIEDNTDSGGLSIPGKWFRWCGLRGCSQCEITEDGDNLVKHRNFKAEFRGGGDSAPALADTDWNQRTHTEKRRKGWRAKLGLRWNNARKECGEDWKRGGGLRGGARSERKLAHTQTQTQTWREDKRKHAARGEKPEGEEDRRRLEWIRVEGEWGSQRAVEARRLRVQKSPSVGKGLRPERRPLKLKVITSKFIDSRREQERIDSHICLKLSSGCVVVQSRLKKESSERE